MNEKGPKEVRIWGIAPVLFGGSVCYAVLACYVGDRIFSRSFFDPLPQYATFAIGDILLFIGAVIFFKSFFLLKQAYRAGILAVDGIYAYMRHPMYAAWIIFMIPGIAIIRRSLFFLSTAVFVYLVYRALIGKEERLLKAQFGEAYEGYQKRVGALLPRLGARRTRP